MKTILFLIALLILIGCGDKITKVVILKGVEIADSLKHCHDNGNCNHDKDTTKNAR